MSSIHTNYNEPTIPLVNKSIDDDTNKRRKNITGKVIVVGSANQDLTCYAPTIPLLGETILGTSFQSCCGGVGANQAIAAAYLGSSQLEVSVVCRLGKDGFGDDTLKTFDEVGVTYNKAVIQTPKYHTGVAPIIVNSQTGDNMIIVLPGANRALTPADVRSELLDYHHHTDRKKSNVVIVTQLEIRLETALEAMKVGKEMGALTILNPSPAQEKTPTTIKEETTEKVEYDDAEFYRNVDILIPNEMELVSLVSSIKGGTTVEDESMGLAEDKEVEVEMAKTLLRLGVKKAVIVTLGARGVMVVSRKQDNTKTDTHNNDDNKVEYEVTMLQADPSLPHHSQPVEDTIGAGDCFCGSLAAYLSAGLELTDAATKACGVASMSVRKKGAQSSYPRKEDLPESLKIDFGGDATTSDIGNESGLLARKQVITFVTGNKKKLEEVQRLLVSSASTNRPGGNSMELPFHITNAKIDLPELQGDPVEIAIEKCKLAAEKVNGPVFTEDTCLCFNALNGMPGPYIKWFLDSCGHDGLNAMLNGFDDKTAYAQTIIAFTSGPGHEVHTFDGRTSGKIVKAKGPLDFGWDPIFEPARDDGGCDKTYAEMEKDEKNLISHRSRSFAKFLPFLIGKLL